MTTCANNLSRLSFRCVLRKSYLYFLVVVAAATLAGGFGGLASAIDVEDTWGKSPRKPEPWLFRLSAYALVINGIIWSYLAYSLAVVLQNLVNDTAIKSALIGGDMVAALFLTMSIHTTNMVMALFPIGVTWGWMIRAWKHAGLWRVLYGAWWLASCAAAVWIGSWLFRYAYRLGIAFNAFFPYYGVMIVSAALVAGMLAGMYSSASHSSTEGYHFSDWVGSALAQGVIGGTQFFISFPAYALVLAYITIENAGQLTSTGLSTQTPAQQIVWLSEILNSLACLSVGLCLLGGLVFGGVVALARKFLKIKSPTPPPDAPVFMD